MPVPLPVVIVRVEGPFTALDRKLWLLLLHNAWDELDTDKPYHEISVAELLRLFRRFGRTDLGTRGKDQARQRSKRKPKLPRCGIVCGGL